MVGTISHLSSLSSRKQLLIAESEINRAQLAEEWRKLADEAGVVAHRAKTVAAWASSAGLLVAAVTALRRGPITASSGKPSGLQKVLEIARAVSAIWLSFRARRAKAVSV